MGKYLCELLCGCSTSPPWQQSHAQSLSQHRSLVYVKFEECPGDRCLWLDRTGQKLCWGMSKKLNNLCHWKPVPLSFIIYCNRCSCHLLLPRSVLKLPSHHDGGNLKPWRHLHGCCGYGARCSGSRTLLRGRRNLLQAQSFPQTVSPYQLCAPCSWWDTPDLAGALCPSMAFLLSGSLVGVLYFFWIWCACCGKKKKKSHAARLPEGIWTISALYLGTEILFACNQKHYLLLPPIKWFF